MQDVKRYSAGLMTLAVCIVLVVLVRGPPMRRTVMVSEWDVLSDNSLVMPKARAANARTQTLMYANPDYPIDHFTFKNQSPDGASGCENQCAFRDKYFTVEDWDKLCIVHCGDIDDMMDIIHYRQKHGVQEGNMILAAKKQAKNMKLAAAHKQALSEEAAAAEEDTTLTDILGNGKKLKEQGVNIDSMPLRVNNLSSKEDVIRGQGVKIDGWPWEAEAKKSGKGLQGVHISGWDGQAFFRGNGEEEKQPEEQSAEHK